MQISNEQRNTGIGAGAGLLAGAGTGLLVGAKKSTAALKKGGVLVLQKATEKDAKDTFKKLTKEEFANSRLAKAMKTDNYKKLNINQKINKKAEIKKAATEAFDKIVSGAKKLKGKGLAIGAGVGLAVGAIGAFVATKVAKKED